MFYFDCEKPNNGTYATVWSVEQNDKGFVKGRISTSEKNKEGEYSNSNWFVTFGKNCSGKALALQPKDRIVIKKFAIKNPSFKKEDGTYVNYLNVDIYHFSVLDEDGNAQTSTEAPKAKGTKFPKPTPPIETMKPTEEEADTKLPFDL